jgi:hypothetical protein
MPMNEAATGQPIAEQHHRDASSNMTVEQS